MKTTNPTTGLAPSYANFDGTPHANRFPQSGEFGYDAVAGLAATDKERARRFTEALWKTPIPSGQNRYYDGMLYLMSLMHLGGEFRIWPPQHSGSLSSAPAQGAR